MKKNLTRNFTEKMQEKIIRGEIKPGDRLPPLRELAEKYGVSRSVVNASVAELESLGYITVRPRKGIIVNDWKREGTLEVMRGVAAINAFDKDILTSILEARRCFECECARLAAIRATPQDLKEMKDLLDTARGLKTVEERTDYDRKFHHKVALMSGNIINALLIKSFERYGKTLLEMFYRMEGVFDFVLAKHEKLYRAILEKDPQRAEKEMDELLNHGENIILKLFNGGKYGELSERG